MVNIAAIRQWNARFANEHHCGRVGVFTGATGGIGAATLTRMMQNLHDSTFYVLGRSEARFAPQKARLTALNPTNKVVFLHAHVSLLADIDAACERIQAAADRVDFVYTSPGVDFGTMLCQGPQYTSESLELTFALSYYARLRLISNLLPLLHRSPHRPCVLSVLNGGREQAILPDDLGLSQPGAWSILRVGSHTTTMTSLAFEHLASTATEKTPATAIDDSTATRHPITFLHVSPGIVKTEILDRMTPPPADGTALAWQRLAFVAVRGIGKVVMGLFGTEVQDCGDRQAYLLTAVAAGEESSSSAAAAAADLRIPSSGAWRIDLASEVVTADGVLKRYREMGLGRRVWEFTEGVFARVRNAPKIVEGEGAGIGKE